MAQHINGSGIPWGAGDKALRDWCECLYYDSEHLKEELALSDKWLANSPSPPPLVVHTRNDGMPPHFSVQGTRGLTSGHRGYHPSTAGKVSPTSHRYHRNSSMWQPYSLCQTWSGHRGCCPCHTGRFWQGPASTNGFWVRIGR